MKRTRFLSLILAVLMCFNVVALTGCGGGNSDEEINELNARIDELDEKLTEANAEIAALEVEKAALATEKAALSGEVTKLEGEIEALEAEIKENEAEISELEAEVARLKALLDGNTADFVEEIEQLEAEMEALTSENGTLKSAKSELEARVAELEGEAETLKAEIAEKNAEITALKASVASLTAEKAELVAENGTLKSDNAELKAENDELEKLVAGLRGCLEGTHSCKSGTCVFCGSIVKCDKDGTPNLEGEYIFFGEYPQTLMAEGVTFYANEPDFRGYYLATDGEYYAKVTAAPHDSGYTFSTGAAVTSGTVYYFKVEPIRWRILEEKNGEAFILCDSIIANHRYDDSSNNYAESEIREWLNGEFYNTAFSALQRRLILTTTVDNGAKSTNPHGNETYWNGGENQYACENTNDKIFLISEEEATNGAYGFDAVTAYDITRRMLTTDYTRASGGWMAPVSDYNGYGWWWLRSPDYSSSDYVRELSYGGYTINYYKVNLTYGGVVPALRIKL